MISIIGLGIIFVAQHYEHVYITPTQDS